MIMFGYDFSIYTWILILFGLPLIPISGLINNWYNKVHKDKTKQPSEDTTPIKTEDKVTKVAIDKVKTKEDHPMGDKTHD